MKRVLWVNLLLFYGISCVSQNKISDVLNYEGEVNKIKINSEEIAYVEQGAGEHTLLFIHGLSSNLEAWRKNITSLGRNYKCVAIDLPGYGKSSKNRNNYSLNEYAAFLRDFIRQKQLENVVPVGHSMGGQIALHLVLDNPEDFEKLVLIAPAGIETFSQQEAMMMKSSYTAAMVENSSPEQIENNYKLNFYSFPSDANFMVEDRIAMKESEDFSTYAQVVVNNISAMLDEPVINDLSRISIPVLMVFGKNDLLIPNKYFHPDESVETLVERAKEEISNLQVELIDEAGHFVNFEKAGEVNSVVETFIENK